jgi:8-amino-7-oxononanoate synthase
MRSVEEELKALHAASLHRSLRTLESPQQPRGQLDGRTLINFSSNDYLGLANAPEVKEALIRGVERWGAGAGASRLVCGTQSPHRALEEALAAFKGTQAALTFSSGYAAAVGTLTALLREGDVVILDKLCHASLIDGARLSGATLRVYPHNNLDRLEHLLQWARKQVSPEGRILAVTESIFSMDGDRSPLREIASFKGQYGALLMVDEAHAFGICGSQGRGLADELGVAGAVDIHMGTLSKAAGLHGGYICSSAALIDLLINRARSFIYSTAPPPAVAAAACEVITQLLPGECGESRRRILWRHLARFAERMNGRIDPPRSAIIPVIIGDEAEAVECSARLLENGFLIPAIRYPTVARGSARLRVTMTAAHEPGDVDALADELLRSMEVLSRADSSS